MADVLEKIDTLKQGVGPELFGLINEIYTDILELKKLSERDPLTGLYNRRGFNRRSEIVRAMAEREGKQTILILIDIDHFKTVNDSYGHDTGDLILKRISREIPKIFKRKTDIISRFGGDEFCILIKAEPSSAVYLAEKLRTIVEKTEIYGIKTTISGGVVHVTESVSEAVSEADRLLYEAKNSGRNTIVFRVGHVPLRLVS
ncbi:MAG: GGDEF domain-containing protein [Desulfobacteraceae bacterium]|nr:GGDEF domain-containing protein [Desulfobacteraceae bacterium]